MVLRWQLRSNSENKLLQRVLCKYLWSWLYLRWLPRILNACQDRERLPGLLALSKTIQTQEGTEMRNKLLHSLFLATAVGITYLFADAWIGLYGENNNYDNANSIVSFAIERPYVYRLLVPALARGL